MSRWSRWSAITSLVYSRSVAIPRGRWRRLAFPHGSSARSAERHAKRKCVRHEEKVRRPRLDEGYHILGALRLQVGVGIVIESTLGKPLHQRSEILAYYIFVELGKHGALLLEIGRELRVRVQTIANLVVVSGPSEALRRNRPHHVQPTRGHPLRSQKAAVDSTRGEGITG